MDMVICAPDARVGEWLQQQVSTRTATTPPCTLHHKQTRRCTLHSPDGHDGVRRHGPGAAVWGLERNTVATGVMVPDMGVKSMQESSLYVRGG